MDIISMINYAAMNNRYDLIRKIKLDIIEKGLIKDLSQEVIDATLQYIDDVLPQNEHGD